MRHILFANSLEARVVHNVVVAVRQRKAALGNTCDLFRRVLVILLDAKAEQWRGLPSAARTPIVVASFLLSFRPSICFSAGSSGFRPFCSIRSVFMHAAKKSPNCFCKGDLASFEAASNSCQSR